MVIREIRGNKKNKGNHEKDSIDIISSLVRLWMSHADGGVYCPSISRDTPLAVDSIWRDTDILGVADRD